MNDDSDQPKTSGWKIAGQILLQLGALVGAGALIYYYFDLERVRPAFENMSIASIVIFVTIMMLVRVINSWRWLDIARESLDIEGASHGYLVRVVFLAQFTNVWFPSFIGGEFVRIWKLGRVSEMSREVALSVALDRMVGVASLAVLCLPFLFLFPHFLPDIQKALQNPFLMWGGVGFVVLLAGAILWKREMVLGLFRQTWHFFIEEKFLYRAMLISMLGYAVIVVAYWYLLETLDTGAYLDIAAVTLIPRFGRIFPVSALGVGAVEGGTLVVGKYLGMSSEKLVVIVAVHIVSKYVASLLGALLEIVFEGRNSLRTLLDEAESGGVADTSGEFEEGSNR